MPPHEPQPAATAPTDHSDGMFDRERRRVLSALRLKVAFTVFVVTMLLGLSSMTFVMVTRIFDRVTPSTRHDLEWKAQRGVIELAQSAQLAMVVGDSERAREIADDYVSDPEVVELVMTDANGQPFFIHSKGASASRDAFAGEPATVRETPHAFRAWAASEIEGAEVGRIALTVSKARLEAGRQLRQDILTTSTVGALIALVLALIFVNFYIGPILRMTALAFEGLERTTQAALEATRLKSEFLANMSHEIRTPMNGIVGVVDLVNRTALNLKQRRYMQTIESSARSLLTIINDILDFSKLEAGKYEIREADVDVRQLAQEVAELMAPKAHDKGIELVQRVDDDVPQIVRTDPDRIRQIVNNLIGNAIKFTERGHVLLRVSLDESDPVTGPGRMLRFQVTDTGVGIREDDQSKLFEMFSQVDGSLTRKHGGTGLGLAISKRLAEAMGGGVGVESRVGRGSRFWVSVRAGEAERQPERITIPRHDARVLLVIRDSAQRESTCSLLESWGMRHESARDIAHATSLVMAADDQPFDAAILDTLDETPGDEVARLLDLLALEGLPLVRLLTTSQTPNDDGHGLPQLFLTKPVRSSELFNGLVALVNGLPLEGIRKRLVLDVPDEPVPKDAVVLVVDDNEINRLVAAELLSEFGYGYETAEDGVQAIELVRNGQFAAVLMDCQMPNMDGYEATRRIRALDGPEARVPIIAVTAHAMAGDREKVLAAGMDDYTAKPVRARSLERVLQRWIRGRHVEPDRPPHDSLEPPPPASSVAPLPQASWDDEVVLDGETPRSARVVGLFLAGVPAQIAAVREAARVGEHDALKKQAHKLKGSCLSLGAAQLAAASRAIELAAASGSIDAGACEQLDPLFRRLVPLLDPGSMCPPGQHPSTPPAE